MDDYLQPDFYRFNQDSLELVRWVKGRVGHCESILDLGAGSGVIGLELARALKPKRVGFVELERDYSTYLAANIEKFLPKEIKSEIYFESFGNWRPADSWDVVVCNPPYYLPGKGELSPDPRKAHARAFLKDDWKILLGLIERSLSAKGKGYLVIKDEKSILAELKSAMESSGLKSREQQSINLLLIELSRLNVD